MTTRAKKLGSLQFWSICRETKMFVARDMRDLSRKEIPLAEIQKIDTKHGQVFVRDGFYRIYVQNPHALKYAPSTAASMQFVTDNAGEICCGGKVWKRKDPMVENIQLCA